jgi:glycosyltransferase involved in cell wall biosynthesis
MTLAARDQQQRQPRVPQCAQSAPVVLVWRNIGPYHIARATAAARLFQESGLPVVVVQLFEREETRDWMLAPGDSDVSKMEIRTLAPGRMLGKRTGSFARQMRTTLDQLQPSCVAVAGYDRPEMREALRWARRNGAVSVLMSETKWDDRPRPWWRRMLASYWVGQADAGLVSGSAAGEYLISLGMPRERVFRQYGVVDNEFFTAASAQARSQKRRPRTDLTGPYFIACCRLIESRKNLRRLVLAFQQYRSGAVAEPWSLVICGDGEDRQALEDFLRERSVEGVVLAGFQQAASLAEYYAHASCFVHPAVNEAWGLVVNEAMACGLPVLVSRRCGCAYDLVDEGLNGFTFDPFDIERLAELMLRMAAMSESERQTMGGHSRKRIERLGTTAFANGLADAMRAAQARP